MKKSKIVNAIVCALLCTSTLSACGGIDYSTPLTDYWLYNYSTVPAHVEETLTYKVTFEASSSLNKNDWTVSYSTGTYTTKLTLGENQTYVYETSLQIGGKFLYGTESSHEFTDSVTTKVVFSTKSKAPVSSFKEIKSTSPVDSASADYYYMETHNKIETTYAADLSSGTTVITDVKNNTSKTSTFAIDKKYTYLDNEQLLFALRGLNQATSPSFFVYAPFTGQVQTIHAKFDTRKEGETFSFTKDGEFVDARAIDYYPITLGIDGKNSGSPQTIWLAAISDPQANTYRNVILQMRTTLAYNVGTLVYTLDNADFIQLS